MTIAFRVLIGVLLALISILLVTGGVKLGTVGWGVSDYILVAMLAVVIQIIPGFLAWFVRHEND